MEQDDKERSMASQVSSRLPDAACLHLSHVEASGSAILMVARTIADQACCPVCQTPTAHVHSHYTRLVADLPWMGWAVKLELHTRRFFCLNLACTRQILTERLPSVVAPYARRTTRLADVLTLVAFALGGEAGKRLVTGMGLATSPDTLLRLIRAAPENEYPTPRILGVDDWRWKRGHTYGTILLDLERQIPIEVLPDREASSLASWLKEHPGVLIVSRDRGGTYAEGVRLGAPGTIQVADRFHLIKNLGDLLQPLLTRHLLTIRKQCQEKMSNDLNRQKEPEPLIKGPGQISPRLAARQKAREDERLARYEQVLALREHGFSFQAIGERLGIGQSTVQRWVKEGQFPKRKARDQSSQLDRFFPSIQQRRSQGCYNMVQLHQELRDKGYQGSYDGMRHILLRVFPKEKPWQRTPPLKEDQPVLFSLTAREATWLFLREPDKLTAKERRSLDHLCQFHEELQGAYQLTQQFTDMLRTRSGGKLDAWLTLVQASPLKEFHPCAKSLLKDLEAVEAGLISPWSNGQTEGQITRLKLIKRQGYGRAGFETLRKRVLHRA